MRTVVVASGKGGTGKTTLTALFAHLASLEQDIVVVDADVEASNLPIALGSEEVSCVDFPGGSKARVRAEACIACGACQVVCRFDAVSRFEPTGAWKVDPWKCEGCGRCVTVCRQAAIEMVPITAGRACLGASRAGSIAFGRLGPGEDLSGKLVTEVRGLGATAASSSEAETVFIDGPPGVGCPVIAAITNTDLLVVVAEPTVSGSHDLARLAELAAQFKLPVRVVLNKADLSEDGARGVHATCARLGLEVIAEIPFDPDLANVLERLATGEELNHGRSEGLLAVTAAWRTVARVARVSA